MVASIMVRLAGIALVAGIVGAIFALWRRGMENPLFLPAARRKTGPLGRLRVACGVLGGLILLGTVVATWQTVRASYTPLPVPAGLTVRVPTRPVSLTEATTEDVTRRVRLLATMLIMDSRATEPRPLHVEQVEVSLPQGPPLQAPTPQERVFTFEGLKCTYNVVVYQAYLEQAQSASPEQSRALHVTGASESVLEGQTRHAGFRQRRVQAGSGYRGAPYADAGAAQRCEYGEPAVDHAVDAGCVLLHADGNGG